MRIIALTPVIAAAVGCIGSEGFLAYEETAVGEQQYAAFGATNFRGLMPFPIPADVIAAPDAFTPAGSGGGVNATVIDVATLAVGASFATTISGYTVGDLFEVVGAQWIPTGANAATSATVTWRVGGVVRGYIYGGSTSGFDPNAASLGAVAANFGGAIGVPAAGSGTATLAPDIYVANGAFSAGVMDGELTVFWRSTPITVVP